MLRKNTASQFVHIAAVNATTGAALTGATISMRRCLDGTFAAGGATITEDTGLGFYKVALTQADTNGNNCAYFFTATNMIPICINVVTTACDPTSTAFGLSLAKTTNITGFNDIAATAIVSSGAITTSGGAVSTVTNVTGSVGSVTGNVGGNVTGSVGSVVGAVGSVTGNVGGNVVGSVASVTAGVTLSTATMTESYAADGAAMSAPQALYMIWSKMAEMSISGTTMTTRKLDGTTSAMTFTLNDATTPSSITRAT